jgi:hypothetical protein
MEEAMTQLVELFFEPTNKKLFKWSFHLLFIKIPQLIAYNLPTKKKKGSIYLLQNESV